MFKYIFSFILLPVMFVTLAMPAQAKAATSYYQYQSTSEQLNYLYAVIAQLQAELNALQAYRPVTYTNYTTGIYTNTYNSNEISSVKTGGVEANNYDGVVFDGEINFSRNNTDAKVWFEYGTNTNLSYSTRSIEIDGDSGDREDFEINATDLDNNRVYYYRAVAEDSNGRYVEGQVKSFRFDRTNYNNNYYYDYNYNNNRYDNDDWSLEVDDDYYETGDTVRVDYEVGDKDSKNWLGLYRVGSSDKNYITSKYVRDDEGYVTFRITQRGDYEFRLFSDDSFDLEAVSDEFEVGY